MRKDRSEDILRILSENGKVEVSTLSQQLGVSQVTIRKDLDKLEASHLIQRIHGYAVLNNTSDMEGRLAVHYEQKKAIAMKAAELIHDGDTLMIESGSTCALLAETLAKTKKNLTIVTNSAFIASYIRQYNTVNTVLTGGIYQNDSQCLVGPMVKEGAQSYHVSYLFIGTDGWSQTIGFTNMNQLRAQAVRDMAPSCDMMVVLTESSKFLSAGTVPLNISSQPKIVVCDATIPQDVKIILETKNIRIITA